MASIDKIQDKIITEKETAAELNGLLPSPDSSQNFLEDIQSPSLVATWRTFIRVIATCIKFHEDLFDAFKAFVEARALAIIPQTDRRLAILAKRFQFGDELVFDSEGQFSYADTTSTDAITKQIITQASVKSANRVITYKVAKASGGGLTELTGDEKTAFTTYVDDTITAGSKVTIISDLADFIKIAYTIQYDPLVIKADGSLIEDGSFPVQEAIDAYIKGLPFNGLLSVKELTDAIQGARGVVNPVADVVQARDETAGYTDILNINTETYPPFSGHFATVDETGSEAVPVYGDIPILANKISGLSDHDATLLYSLGSFVIEGGVVFKSNVAITGGEAFDSTKWDTVSNLTFISK
tara:strand:+ start:3660 stop:4724 length:1065 start_codon:yes stop_codon:yes gene_type:complete